MASGRLIKPQAVLFACGSNSIRSPMALALMQSMFPKIYAASAGVRKGEVDPFAVTAMDEIGRDIAKHRPMTFEELEDWEGLNFDLIITHGLVPIVFSRERVVALSRRRHECQHAGESDSP